MELKKAFLERRSVNFFVTQKSLPPVLITQIYDLAKLAPSSFNLQPWKIILVQKAENKQKLMEAALNQPKVAEASAMLIILGDTQGYEEADTLLEEGIRKGYFDQEAKQQYVSLAHHLYGNPTAARGFALRNSGLLAMSLMLAAKEFGVDTHPMDGFEPEKVKRAFNIPERYEVAMLIAMGYHDENKALLLRQKRKDYQEVFILEGF